MPTGTVRWFNTTKENGVIAPEDGSKNRFVHTSAVKRAGLRTLHEGRRVSYELRPGRAGKSAAENLSVADRLLSTMRERPGARIRRKERRPSARLARRGRRLARDLARPHRPPSSGEVAYSESAIGLNVSVSGESRNE